MFTTKKNQPPLDLSLNGETVVDQGRMNCIASRVEQRLRLKRDESMVPLVHDFSELCFKHGADVARDLVAPVEQAIVECGWAPTKYLEHGGKACRIQIFASKPDSPAEFEATLRIDQYRMNNIASHVEERLRFHRHETVIPFVHDYSELYSRYGGYADRVLVAPVVQAIVKSGWIAAKHLDDSSKTRRTQIVATRMNPSLDARRLEAEFNLDQGRMHDIASRVADRLRINRPSTVVTLVHDYSELCAKYGKCTADTLVAPVEKAIAKAGWLPTKQEECGSEAGRLQIVAKRRST